MGHTLYRRRSFENSRKSIEGKRKTNRDRWHITGHCGLFGTWPSTPPSGFLISFYLDFPPLVILQFCAWRNKVEIIQRLS